MQAIIVTTETATKSFDLKGDWYDQEQAAIAALYFAAQEGCMVRDADMKLVAELGFADPTAQAAGDLLDAGHATIYDTLMEKVGTIRVA